VVVPLEVPFDYAVGAATGGVDLIIVLVLLDIQ
jgi:hypothetical protein